MSFLTFPTVPFVNFPLNHKNHLDSQFKGKKVTQMSFSEASMATEQIAHHREDAEIYHGVALCKQKSQELLKEISLPKGLLPLDDFVEVGYNRTTGFVWLKQKKKKEHRFRAIERTVSYDAEVTAFVDQHRMRRVTGVKSKEMFIWVTISEISIEDPNSCKIFFSNSSGISRAFPVSAFDLEEEED